MRRYRALKNYHKKTTEIRDKGVYIGTGEDRAIIKKINAMSLKLILGKAGKGKASNPHCAD